MRNVTGRFAGQTNKSTFLGVAIMKRLMTSFVILAAIAGSATIAEAHILNMLQPGCHKHYPPPPSQHFKRTHTHPVPGAKLLQHVKDHVGSGGGNCNGNGGCSTCQ
jgi:hypothetical protein